MCVLPQDARPSCLPCAHAALARRHNRAPRPLWGTLEEIREDVRRYAEAGLTELFLEANFDPTGRTALRLIEVIEALAPES